MNAVGWAALAAAVAVLPGPSQALMRTDALLQREWHSPEVGSRHGMERRAGQVNLRALSLASCGAAAAVTTLAAGPVLGLAAGVVAATIGVSVLIARDARTGERREQELVSALHLLAAELSSGSSPEPALRAAAEACSAHCAELNSAADAVARGEPPEFGAGELVPLGRAWQVAADSGAPLADVVGRVAGDVAARITRRRDVSAAVAGARSSAALLAVLPALGLLLGAAMQAHPLQVLFGSPAGRLLCLVGVVLDACGLAWTHRLAVGAQRP